MTRPGMAMTLTECAGEKYIADVERWRKCFDYSQDAFGLTAVDPNGQGVQIIAPLAEVTNLSRSTRLRWQMVGAHLAAGHRLRIAAESASIRGADELPHQAEAIVDPRGFRVADATGDGRSSIGSTRTTDDISWRFPISRRCGIRARSPNARARSWRSPGSAKATSSLRIALASQEPR